MNADSPLIHEVGLTADSVFTDPRIHVWRSLPDRENATLDHRRDDGSLLRLHIKRYPASAGRMALNEVAGHRLLIDANVPAASILASGSRSDGRSYIILEDLAGYTPADKLLEQGFDFNSLLDVTAELAAMLHQKQLHHRDLYLCHFMIRPGPDSVEARLIDMARVDRLRSIFTRQRWIVKDLAQFWYSTIKLPVTEPQRRAWLDRYCSIRKLSTSRLIASVQRKALAIGRHDRALNRKQPNRNVSIGIAQPPG